MQISSIICDQLRPFCDHITPRIVLGLDGDKRDQYCPIRNISQEALTGGVLISNMGRLDGPTPVNVWIVVFYPAMLENEEDNIVKLPLHDQNNVRFGS